MEATKVKSKKYLLTPRLRFPEFQDGGEWEKKEISELLTIGNGKDYKHLSAGTIPVYGTGGYMLSVNDYLYDGESVCIGRKGTIDNPFFVSGKFWTVDTLFYTHKFNNTIPKFIYFCFQRIKWSDYNAASGVPSLSKSTIERIEIAIPTLKEQKKIADCLSSLDERITAETSKLDRLKEHKKGLLKQLFPEDGDTLPKLRFPAFQSGGEWRKVQLSEIAIPVFERATDGDADAVLTLSAEHGVVAQGAYFGKKIAGDDVTRYIKIKNNDFVYNDRTTKAYKYGTIKRLSRYSYGIVSPIYKCFRFNNEEIPHFWEWYFEAGVQDAQLYSVINEGAKSGRFNISIQKFLSIFVFFPDKLEQKRIVACLSSLDALITAQTQKIDLLKDHKKGLMQQLFPRIDEVMS